MEDETMADLEWYKAAYALLWQQFELTAALKKYYRDQARYLKEQNKKLIKMLDKTLEAPQ